MSLTVLIGVICCDSLHAQGQNLRKSQPSQFTQPPAPPEPEPEPQPEVQPIPQTQPALQQPHSIPSRSLLAPRTQPTQVQPTPTVLPTQPQPESQSQPGPQSQAQRPAPNQPLPPLDAQTIAADPHTAILRLMFANVRRRPVLTESTPDMILSWCYPFGSQAMVINSPGTQPVYAVGALCWNFPCQGKVLFRVNGEQVVARVGAGYQQYPGSFLAMLAFSEILPNYEIRNGNEIRTLAHLIETEKRNCMRGQNLALVLAGLSFYTSPDEYWSNMIGESWSLERIVAEELSRRADQSSPDVTNQLLGLSAAIRAYQSANRPLAGPLADAMGYLETCQRFALSIQNNDGTWHPNFFISKGTSADVDGVLYASSHILRFLVYSLPHEQLQTPQMQRGVVAVAAIIAKKGVGSPLSQMSDRQLEGITVGLQALRIYDERVYGTNYSNLE
jgi:hypothetical protein